MACAAIAIAACTSATSHAPAAHPAAHPAARPAAPPLTPARRADAALEGLYRAPHATRYRCDTGADGWCDADVEDLMAVADHGDGTLGVHVLISADNAHSCTFAGDLKQEPVRGAPRWVFHDEANENPCTLSLEKADTGLELHATGCRDYCGTRASLDAAFTLHD